MNILRYQDSAPYWKKSYLKSQQFLDQFLEVHYFQLNKFHLCEQPYQIGEVLLFSKIAYCLQQTLHLDFHNILFFLRQLVGFRYGKKHFVKIVTSFVTVLFKMTLYICIYFAFTKQSLF